MSNSELKDQLRAIVIEVAELDDDKVEDSAKFKDLGIDSMMAIEIVADVERQYKVKIPEDELATITDLDSVVRLVKSKLP